MTTPKTPPTPTPPAQFATPDITLAQIASAVAFVAAQAVAYGLISNDAAQQIISIAGVVLPAIWTLADAHIRHGRATGSATK